jgi:acyl-phosphate glycerol 3-phosphate acyltransferase
MRAAIAAAMIVAGYLLGSVNVAIIVTRLKTGKDIRTLGNGNPGTANVGRTLGRGWGALVFFGDVLKSLAPMLAARLLFFPGGATGEILAVFAPGLAAIVGHARPLYHRFRGGGGAASALPVMFFFAPVEAMAALLLACLGVLLFVGRVRFRLGRWIPMLFLLIAPFLTAAVNALVRVPLGARLSIGGHPWAVAAGMFAAGFLVLGFSFKAVRQALSDAGRRHLSA